MQLVFFKPTWKSENWEATLSCCMGQQQWSNSILKMLCRNDHISSIIRHLWDRRGHKFSPYAIHEMCKIVHGGDVIVVGLKLHIWVDSPVNNCLIWQHLIATWYHIKQCKYLGYHSAGHNSTPPTTPQVTVPECVFRCLYFAEASLVRLEEKPVHIGQLHFVIVKQDELYKEEARKAEWRNACCIDGHCPSEA